MLQFVCRMGRIGAGTIGLFTVFLTSAVAAGGEVDRDPGLRWLDNELYKLIVEIRPRIELADQDGLDASQAYTIRSRVGLEVKRYFGFSALAELLNVWSLDDDSYYDGASTPNGDTTIADPERTELNRAWLQFARPNWLGSQRERRPAADPSRRSAIRRQRWLAAGRADLRRGPRSDEPRRRRAHDPVRLSLGHPARLRRSRAPLGRCPGLELGLAPGSHSLQRIRSRIPSVAADGLRVLARLQE